MGADRGRARERLGEGRRRRGGLEQGARQSGSGCRRSPEVTRGYNPRLGAGATRVRARVPLGGDN